MPQAVSVDGSLIGYENLLIFAKLYDIPHREQEGRIRERVKITINNKVYEVRLGEHTVVSLKELA